MLFHIIFNLIDLYLIDKLYRLYSSLFYAIEKLPVEQIYNNK